MDEIDGLKFLIGLSRQLVGYFYTLLSGAKSNLERLEGEVRLLEGFLVDASKIDDSAKDARFKVCEREIVDVVHEADILIACCKVQAEADKHRNFLGRTFGCLTQKKISLAEKVKALRKDRVRPLFDDKSKYDFVMIPINPPPPVIAQSTPVKLKNPRQNNLIQLDKEMDDLIHGLTEASAENFEVFSIVGMAGLGKTTMAWRIYNHLRSLDIFRIVVWVKISQVFNKKDVCLAILEELGEINLSEMTVDQLSATICTRLEKVNSMIILDGVWTNEVWSEIKELLPVESNHKCKVLITTRVREVAMHASTGKPHELRPLCAQESWELIQLDVFGDLDSCPPELVDIGKQVAQDCDGLPFTIVMMAGILYHKWKTAPGTMEAKEEWRRVSGTLRSYGGSDDQEKSFSKIISLSFDTLISRELKICFLDLGKFPEGTEISVRHLTWMWIAQEYIVARNGRSLEEIAEDHCKELIDKSLLLVVKRKPDGEVKTCCVPDLIRNFCKKEAAKQEENTFIEIKLSREGVFEPEVEKMKSCRHICIHSFVMNFLIMVMKKLDFLKAYSFLSFSKEFTILDKKHMALFTNAFRFLRVLHVKMAIKFPEFPAKLILLKYVSLSCDESSILPKSLSKLCDLQTLELDTSSTTIDCKANIWKMVDLRHFKTKASVTLSNLNGKGDGGECLRTLKRISPESCSSELFSRLNNLKDLGIRGNLAKLLGTNHGLDKLHRLDKLELMNGLSPEEAVKNPMPGLPQPNKFPPNVRTIKLSDTYLDWDNMSVLAQVNSLEVLKLKGHAFKGHRWDATGCCFDNVEYLYISDADLRLWEASRRNFPKLRKLVLINCKNLESVPDDLVKGLHLLYMEGCRDYAISCAEKIEKEMKQEQGQRPGQKGRFQLKIVPREDDCQYTFASDHTN